MLLWPGICIVHQAFSETELLKLKAAGFSDAKVVAKFPQEGDDTSQWDVSTSYENAVKEAERREAAKRQQ
jgi:quinolinate synthase